MAEDTESLRQGRWEPSDLKVVGIFKGHWPRLSEIHTSAFDRDNAVRLMFTTAQYEMAIHEMLTSYSADPRCILAAVAPKSSKRLKSERLGWIGGRLEGYEDTEVLRSREESHTITTPLKMPRDLKSKEDEDTGDDWLAAKGAICRLVGYLSNITRRGKCTLPQMAPANEEGEGSSRAQPQRGGGNGGDDLPRKAWPSRLALMIQENAAQMQKKYMSRQKFIYINTMAVDPSSQGKGIGTFMLRWIAARAEREGVPLWVQSSPTARDAYKGVGFEDVDHWDVNLAKFVPGRAKDCSGWGSYRFFYMRRMPNTAVKMEEALVEPGTE